MIKIPAIGVRSLLSSGIFLEESDDLMGTEPAGKRGPRKFVDIQGSFLPGSRTIHSDEQEIRQRRPKTCVDE